MKDKILLALGGLLIALYIVNPDFSNILKPSRPTVVNTEDIPDIKNEDKISLESVVKSLTNGSSDRKIDGKKLASLYLDMSTLIGLDGEDETIKSTNDIRQANSLVGPMLKLNLKDKYPDLKKSCTDYIVSQIGDDNVPLNSELRSKASQAFLNLAWACNEGSK